MDGLQPTIAEIKQEIAEAMPFSKKLMLIRKATGLTYEAIAQHVGVSRTAVSRWKKGHSLPKETNVSKLAALMGMKTSDLLVFQEPHNTATFRDVLGEQVNVRLNLTMAREDAMAVRRLASHYTEPHTAQALP